MTETKKVCCAVKENPVMLLLLGACPAMAVTTNVLAALGMGVAITVIMLLTGICVSLLKNVIPARVKAAAFILVAAGFTALVQMVMQAWLPSVASMLGVYLAVVAVSALVFRHADKVAANSCVKKTAVDALSVGALFTVVIVLVAAVREFFGAGSICGFDVAFMQNCTVPVLAKATGGYIVFALAAAVVNAIRPATCCCKKEGE